MTRHFLNRFTQNVSGGVMIWAAVAAPIMLSGAALSVDVSRIYNLDEQLQSASDALARAGAAELDGRSDSIIRSTRAVNSLVNNSQSYSEAGYGKVEVSSFRFLKSLPANDYDAPTADMVTTDPHEAKYIEVSVKPVTIRTLFPPKLSQGITSVTLSATSIAGFTFGVCGVAPIFVCNPYEGSGISLFEALEDPAQQRRQIRFIDGSGPESNLAPGSFGFLDPFSSNGTSGANLMKDAIAMSTPPTCFGGGADGVNLRPGNLSSVGAALNVRFDIYKGRYSSAQYRSDPQYAPAKNVVKGYASDKNKTCQISENEMAFGLPKDACFATNSCTGLGGSMGDGNWNFLEYVRINHNAAPTLDIFGTVYHFNYSSETVTPSVPPSRYAMYRWEIESDRIPGEMSYGIGNTNTPEEGAPQCHDSGGSSGGADRRIIHAAVLNCGELAQSYDSKTQNLPAQAFAKVFITEPMGNGEDNTIYGEMVGVVLGSDFVSRDNIAVTR